MSADAASPASRRVLPAALAAGLFGLVTIGYLLASVSASPGVAIARNDLEIVREWQRTGRLDDHATDPTHLKKPGYVAYLRWFLPHTGSDAAENRRFLLLNTVWLLAGALAALASLWTRNRKSAVVFLLFLLLYVPARDSTDYITSEPLAMGFALLFLTALPFARHRTAAAALGVAAAASSLYRPNLGVILIVLGALVVFGSPLPRRGGAALLLGFAACVGMLVGLGRVAGDRSDPFTGTRKALLWGSADYYWRWSVPELRSSRSEDPSEDLSPREPSQMGLRELVSRIIRRPPRSLLWSLGHGWFSAEPLPPRVDAASYQRWSKALREWWWLAAALIAAACVAAATGGRGPWRFVPVVLLAMILAQSVILGSDPRLALPFVPALAYGLARVGPEWKPTRVTTAAFGCALVAAIALVLAVPDVANSDFALVRGPGHGLEQEVRWRGRLDGTDVRLNLRLLQEPPFAMGLNITANGRTVFRRAESAASEHPAFLSIPIPAELLEAGGGHLCIRIETLGDENAFAYFPVVPRMLRPSATLDGSSALPSGYGGTARGGIPMWLERVDSRPALTGGRAASRAVRRRLRRT